MAKKSKKKGPEKKVKSMRTKRDRAREERRLKRKAEAESTTEG